MNLPEFSRTKFLKIVMVIAPFAMLKLIGFGGRTAMVGDMIPFKNPNDFFNEIQAGWNTKFLLGVDVTTLYLNRVPIFGLFTGLHGIFGADYWTAFLFLLFLLMGYSAYYLTKDKGSHVALFSMFVYMINPWTINRIFSGHYLLLLFYALIPVWFKCSMRWLEHSDLKALLVSCLIFSFAGYTQIHNVAIELVLITTISTAFIIIKRSRKALVSSTIMFLTNLTFFILLNAFWVLPTIMYKNSLLLALSSPIEDFYTFSRLAFPPLVITLNGFWWIYDITLTFLLVIYGALLLYLAVKGARYTWKTPATKVLVAVTFVASLVGCGPYSPLGPLFSWAFGNISFFSLFREPNKFVMLSAFAYTYLASYGVQRFSKPKLCLVKVLKPIKRIFGAVSKQRLLAGTLILVVVSYSPVLLSPNLTNSFPSEYHEVDAWLSSKGEEPFNAIFIPSHVYVETNWLPYGVADPIKFFFNDKFVVSNDAPLYSRDTLRLYNLIVNFIASNRTNRLGEMLNMFNIRYVIVRLDIKNDVEPLGDPENFLIALRRITDLTPVQNFNEFFIFENNQWRKPGFFWGTNKSGLIVGSPSILLELSHEIGLNFSETAFWFTNNLHDLSQIKDLSNFSDFVLFYTGDLYNLLPTILSSYRVEPYDYARGSVNPERFWIKYDPEDINSLLSLKPSFEELTYGKGWAFTSASGNTLELPLNINYSGEHDIFIRIMETPSFVFNSSDLEVSTSLDSWIIPSASYMYKARWIKIPKVFLRESESSLTIKSLGNNPNLVDEVIVAPSSEVANLLKEAIRYLEKIGWHGILIDAEDVIQPDWCVWNSSTEAYGGHLISNYNSKVTKSFELLLSRTGTYSVWIRGIVRDNTSFSFTVENRRVSRFLGNSSLEWIYVGDIPIEEHNANITVEIEGTKQSVALDAILLVNPSTNKSEPLRILGGEASTLSYEEMVNNVKYRVRMSRSEVLIFRQSFSPLWRAINTSATEVNAALNSFIIQDNPQNVLIEYSTLKWVNAGYMISAIALLFSLLLILMPRKIRFRLHFPKVLNRREKRKFNVDV